MNKSNMDSAPRRSNTKLSVDKYLPESNTEYQEAILKKVKGRVPKPYGARELEIYGELQKMKSLGKTERYGKPIEQELREVFKLLKVYLERDIDSLYHGEEYQKFLQHFLEDPEFTEELGAFIATKGIVDINKAKTFFGDYENNNELWAEVLEKHIREFREREQLLAKEVEKAKQEFLLKAKNAIKIGKLPITEELLEKRVAETIIYIRDRVEDPRPGSWQDNAMFIVDNIAPEDIKHAVFHELVHALSGRIIARKKFGDTDMKIIEHVKLGLAVTHRGENNFPHTKYDALNEALTETYALELLGKPADDNRARVFERGGLMVLVKKGLREDLLRNAYFENYDPESNTKLPAWNALMANIRENKELRKHFRWQADMYGKYI